MNIKTVLFAVVFSVAVVPSYAQTGLNISGLFQLTAKVAVSWSDSIQVMSNIKLKADRTISGLNHFNILPEHFSFGSTEPAQGTWVPTSNNQVRAVTYQQAHGGKLCDQAGLDSCIIKIEADLKFKDNNQFELSGSRGTITVYDTQLKTGKTLPIILELEGTRL